MSIPESDPTFTGLASRKLRNKNGVCSVIVTYNPEIQLLSKAIISAQQQTDFIVIVDNSSKISIFKQIESLLQHLSVMGFLDPKQFLLKKNNGNFGLPKSYNYAAEVCLEKKLKYLLLLDQDSILEDGAVSFLLEAYNSLSKSYEIGGVFALNIEKVRGFDNFLNGFYKRKQFETIGQWRETFFAWNSGLMIPIGTLMNMGGFDEHYFLDCVDQEICFRLHNHEKKIFLVENAKIKHERGQVSQARFLWQVFTLKSQAPIRFYYIARDTLKLTKTYFRKFSTYVIFLWLSVSMQFLFILLFYRGRSRTESIFYFGKGLLHYFKRHSGILD